MKKILVLKDNFNSFEQFYIDSINALGIDCQSYYNNDSKIRKLFTHLGLFGERFFYGDWKYKLNEYDTVIVFDCLHNPSMLFYLKKLIDNRFIFWHWNPILTDEDFKIWEQTKDICEHWTFNPADAEKYDMKLNNQFFFFQDVSETNKENTAFFVGTDKGRYNQLLSIADSLEKYGVRPDFHIIDQRKKGRFIQKDYVEYDEVINHLRNAKYAVEICQEGQTGLTARALEAMFFGTKLITNNKFIKNCEFYKKTNIYIIGEDNDFEKFLSSPFEQIEREKLYPYSAEGWIERFMRG